MPKLDEVAKANRAAQAVTAELARRLIEAALKKDKPIWIWGIYGIGKSALVSQIALAHGARLIDVRLSQYQSEDLTGIPFPDLVAMVTRWLRPELWPTDPDELVYIFLDEMDRAKESVLNAALQIVLDRRAGQFQFHKNVRILAAGNGETDSGTQSISGALANRFTHIYMVPDAKVLARHYESIGAPQIMIDFIGSYRPNLVHGPAVKGEHASPSPRAWSTVIDWLDLPDVERGPLVRGTVGSAAGDEFNTFFSYYRDMVPLADIIANPRGAKVPSMPGALYAVSSAIARAMDFQNVANCIAYLERLPVEFKIMALKAATDRFPALKECRAVIDWRLANQHVDL